MLGLFAMLLSSVALIAVASYWIFWEMEPVDRRPTFVSKLKSDFTGLFSRTGSAPHVAAERPSVS